MTMRQPRDGAHRDATSRPLNWSLPEGEELGS